MPSFGERESSGSSINPSLCTGIKLVSWHSWEIVQLSLKSAIFSCFQGDVQHDIDNCINPQFTQCVEAAALFQCLLLNEPLNCDLSAKKNKMPFFK